MGNKKNLSKWIYWGITIAIIVVIYKVLENSNIISKFSDFVGVLKPFLIGIFISYILYVPCKKIEKLYKSLKSPIFIKRARGLSVLTIYIIAVFLIAIIINFVIPPIVQSGVDFSNNFQSYYDVTLDKVLSLQEKVGINSDLTNGLIDEIKNMDIKQFIDLNKITEYAKNVFNFAKGIFDIFIAIVVSIYILLERSEIINFFGNFAKALFKPKLYKSIKRYFFKSNEIFFRFVSSQLLDAIIVGIFVTIIMLILNVKYGILLGLFIGLFNLIPYFGALIAVGCSILITLATGGLSQAIWMAVLVIIVQQLDANFIGPKIVGNSLKISPLLVIFSVTLAGSYFGVLGMFLAVPIIAVIKLAIDEFIEAKNEK